MSGRSAQRELVHHRVPWWVVTAWSSLALVVLAGLAAAAGAHLGCRDHRPARRAGQDLRAGG